MRVWSVCMCVEGGDVYVVCSVSPHVWECLVSMCVVCVCAYMRGVYGAVRVCVHEYGVCVCEYVCICVCGMVCVRV